MITQERLKEILNYNDETGIFTWKAKTCRKVVPGTKAGRLDSYGYMVIGIEGKIYRAHRLAWFYMTGKWPVVHIDHRDGNPSNNRWYNLRECNQKENGQNLKKNKRNSTGYSNVYYLKRTGRWYSRIQANGKNIYLGYYDTPEMAYKSFLEAKQKYHTFQPTLR